jgi:predicted transcriptional regulator of viral defense system
MDIKMLKRKFKDNGGILRTAEFTALKIDYRGIQKLITSGKIEKIKNGYYHWIENKSELSEQALIAKLYPDGVICMCSALFYYKYTDRTPLNWDIAVNKDVSKARFKIDYPYVQPYYMEPDSLTLGVTTADYGDCTMQIFDRDRLVCECLKYESKMDRETFNKAIQAYINDPKKNVAKLLEYARKRRISKRVKDLIGVWL